MGTSNYNASYGEKNHSTHAKIPGRRALRRVQTFDHSIANRVTDTYCLRKFRELCRASQKELKRGTYMELVDDLESDSDSDSDSDYDMNDDDDDSEDKAVPLYHALGLPDPRVAYATRYTIVCTPFRNNDREPYQYNTVCTWHTRSKGLCRLAPGLIQFLVSHFRLAQGNTVRTLHGFTQYKHNGHQYRCHPNYRSENRGWYDWAFMRYQTAGGNESMLPVRFQTFIKDIDSDDPDLVHPVIQWCQRATARNSVLFKEYEFAHDRDGNTMKSFRCHPVDCIERPCMVYAPLLRPNNDPKDWIMVAVDYDQWAELFA
jgi:hypothetical protein